MGDNSSTDEENYPQFGGNRIKLDDGSSQDRFTEPEGSLNNDENEDSGVSADRYDSTVNEDNDREARAGPANQVVNAGHSGNNCCENPCIPRQARNYRRQREADAIINPSTNDTDDMPAANYPTVIVNETCSRSDTDSNDPTMLAETFNLANGTTSSVSSPESVVDSDFSISDMFPQTECAETESEPGFEPDPEVQAPNNVWGLPAELPPVQLTTRPKRSYWLLKEILNREMGMTVSGANSTRQDLLFERRLCGSLHVIYRLKQLHTLNGHSACVNSINFHPEGHLLVSASDDRNVIVWDWARNKVKQIIKSGHSSHVLQSKFMFLNADSQFNIVTCGRDGQVRLLQSHPSGCSTCGCESGRTLVVHSRAVHNLHVCAAEPHVVISAGEDGLVMQSDVRTERASSLIQVRDRCLIVPLYSVAGNSRNPHELIVAGRNKFVRLYDLRNCYRPVSMYCPTKFNFPSDVPTMRRMLTMHLTSAVFNHDGTQILGSYNDEDIFLFDVKKDTWKGPNSTQNDGYTHRYSGHRNHPLVKGVSFFGPKSEYIISGSDCSYIYVWDRDSESIIQWLKGDTSGAVSCIETHPRFPVLATSGLEKNVKIWIPNSQSDPTSKCLEGQLEEQMLL